MISSGDLKSLRPLWTILAKSHRYVHLVEARDILEFEVRARNEGIGFLTTTLPKLGKALDEFHATTVWTAPFDFKLDDDGCTQFLGKAIRLALGGSSQAVDCVRQLTYLFYKLEVDYEETLVAETIERFESTDRALLALADDFAATKSIQDHLAFMKRIICRVLLNADPWVIRPCHGSGATACRTKNKDKWDSLRYFPKLDLVYPYADYFFYSATHLVDEMQKLEDSPESVPRARVVLVPKDSRGPRIISCEPAELMFVQQGLMRLLYDTIESHYLTQSQINFSDQSINQSLAHQSSIDGVLATIDLSDASDRLSLLLVEKVFPSDWVKCLKACRSEETILPSGKVLKLNKFAPMGSACCFPVEALVFWASTQATYERLGVKAETFVYGDDIICPVGYADEVCKDLVSIGLKVNATKSYTKGPFRESCGGEYHNGYDVTPVRVRKFLGQSHTDLSTAADFCNNLIAKFGEASSLAAIQVIEDQLDYVFPRSTMRIPCVIFGSGGSNDLRFRKRWNKSLQRFEYRILQLSTRVLTCRETTWSELLRSELTVKSRGVIAGKTPPPEMGLGGWTPEGVGRVEPGKYADNHAARATWRWVWLD